LILPCEVAVRSVVPAIKALMARQLMEEQGLNQEEVAELLGVSQSAVSKYSRKIRGHSLNVEDVKEIHPFINEMTAVLLDDVYRSDDLLSLFCRACVIIRKTGLMCAFCEKSDPKIKMGSCKFCINQVPETRGGLF
jgi:predicted transcriptional regulator